MRYKILTLVVVALMLLGLASPVLANPPYPQDEKPPVAVQPPGEEGVVPPTVFKPFDQPNPLDYWRNMERQRLLEEGKTDQASAKGLSGSDRVLVILVEFAGTDVFTWTAGTSTWDPLGRCNSAQDTGTQGDCSLIVTQTQVFTYTGPLHNQIPRPLSATDVTAHSIWTENFTKDWFQGFLFGNGVTFNYDRQDGSHVYADFTGKSVRNYYQDLSKGAYDIHGDVIGWVTLPHSTWWYGADPCPGARSVPTQGFPFAGGIPGAGGTKSLVTDALDAVNAISNTIPGFKWSDYDLNGDGVIDRLWIVHAGLGEEDSTVWLNRTDYGEASMWSHSSAITPYYPVGDGMSAGPYIMMPENGGIGVFAHEYGHNLGAQDLYAYGYGNPSAGFWTLMSDDWTGEPIGFMPPAPDPYHLDNWGWLNPKVIFDPSQVYQVTLGQASSFPGGTDVYRGAKIVLPNGSAPLPLSPWQGSYYWWGGKKDETNSMMTTKNAIALTGAPTATLSFDLAYDIEPEWDFLWVQVSEDGVNWNVTDTLTNTNTSCVHDPGWIGGLYGFPDDLCAAGIGGLTGYGHMTPATQTFDLSRYAGKNVYLRFWYMTDWGTTGAGPFVDNVAVKVGDTTVFSDDAESGDAKWTYAAPWQRSDGTLSFTQNYYLQWRNVGADGGYDSALGDSRWRYGPANTGLLVWYNNNFYNDNEVYNYLMDGPSFGPKGRMLVVDSHGEPYRDPVRSVDYPNAISDLASRGQMRDAPFSRSDTVNFTYPLLDTPTTTVQYAGRPAASMFWDALGYYPGLEYARRGPLPCTQIRLFDEMWDTSAVLPALDFYTTKATNGTVTTADGIRMRGFISAASACQAGWYGYWYIPYDNAAVGNTGNPGDDNVDYGWRVQIVSQTAQTAMVKIWNTHYYGALQPNVTVANKGDTVRYTFTMRDYMGTPGRSVFVCIPLDTSKVEYVAGSATGGAVPFSVPCSELAPGQAAASAAEVKSIGWVGNFDPDSDTTFSFDVKIKAGFGLFDQDANLYSDGALWATIPAEPVKVNPAYQYLFPLAFKDG